MRAASSIEATSSIHHFTLAVGEKNPDDKVQEVHQHPKQIGAMTLEVLSEGSNTGEVNAREASEDMDLANSRVRVSPSPNFGLIDGVDIQKLLHVWPCRTRHSVRMSVNLY